VNLAGWEVQRGTAPAVERYLQRGCKMFFLAPDREGFLYLIILATGKMPEFR